MSASRCHGPSLRRNDEREGERSRRGKIVDMELGWDRKYQQRVEVGRESDRKPAHNTPPATACLLAGSRCFQTPKYYCCCDDHLRLRLRLRLSSFSASLHRYTPPSGTALPRRGLKDEQEQRSPSHPIPIPGHCISLDLHVQAETDTRKREMMGAPSKRRFLQQDDCPRGLMSRCEIRSVYIMCGRPFSVRVPKSLVRVPQPCYSAMASTQRQWAPLRCGANLEAVCLHEIGDLCEDPEVWRCYPGGLINALPKRMAAEITSSKWHSCNPESMKNDIPVLGFKSQMEERLLKDATARLGGGTYDEPLPCFGCGIGWFSFLVGFVFPPMWFYATILYFRSYYRKDLRERLGLQASAFAALIFSVVAVIIAVAVVIGYFG
ncbi:hypothetical protein ACLOJK_039787 [Asimina triloba]